MKQLIQLIIDCLQESEDFVIATVIIQKGSTPRGIGAKMMISKNRKSVGSIGGGLVEAEVIKVAQEVLKTKTSIVFDFDMTHETLTPDNMICGGKMEILVDFIKANKENQEIFTAVNQAFQSREKAFFLTCLKETPEALVTQHYFINESNNLMSDASLFPDGLKTELKTGTKHSLLLAIEDKRFMIEQLLIPPKLFIFGAGHVSKPTAALGLSTGFRTIVIDDRESCITRDFFPKPIAIRLISEFNNCFNDLKIDRNSYLVIVTRGHIHDKIVLEQALKSRAKYIGMIGSRKKRDTIYKNMLDNGFSEEALERVHCPIGLNIGAETPEELAVSIVSELIQVRADQN